jgi:RHS repeat-associated protein
VESIASSNPNGVSVTLTWDELNRLSTVIDNRLPSGANTAVYTYDAAGNVATATYPNGFQTTFTYDQLSRMTAVSTPVSSYSYQLGPTGNRIGATEGNGRTLQWNYDGIYRLTNETISGDPSKNNGSVSYGLDAVGNRLSQNSSLPGINSGSWGYNADDQISSESYDADGNVIAAGGYTMTYDAENHLISKIGNGTVITQVYDAFGNRVSKTVNGVSTKYLVEDDVNPTGLPQVLEETVNGVVQRTYTYGLQRISESQMLNGSWTTSFYVYDGAGSVRQLTNSAGVVTDEYEYDAYGNSFTKQGTTPNNYLYRGEQFDSDLGLYYLRARYYNPATDRFMSRDPEDGDEYSPASLHKYLYANGDPVNLADPTGRTAATATWGGGGDLAEYGMLIGAIAIAAQPAVRALGCAVSASFAYDALKVFGAGAFQVDLPVETQGCGAGSHCIPYEEAIEAAMSEVEARYDEMLLDFYGLYGCRNKKNPWLPGIGSWWGHVDAYLAAQAELVAAIKAAEAAGCPIPPGAEYWAEQPPPSCPSK